MNKVISREYVEKNYIHKDKIKKLINYKRDLIKQIENITLGKIKTTQERNEIARLKTEIYELNNLLEDK